MGEIIDEIVDFVKELWLEIKALPSDVKGLFNKVRDDWKEFKDEVDRIIEKEAKKVKIKEKATKQVKDKIIVHKGRSNWFANACLLYLCVFNTLVVLGLVAYVNEKVPVVELLDMVNRCRSIRCFDRFIKWVETEMPLITEWRNVSVIE